MTLLKCCSITYISVLCIRLAEKENNVANEIYKWKIRPCFKKCHFSSTVMCAMKMRRELEYMYVWSKLIQIQRAIWFDGNLIVLHHFGTIKVYKMAWWSHNTELKIHITSACLFTNSASFSFTAWLKRVTMHHVFLTNSWHMATLAYIRQFNFSHKLFNNS